MEVEQLAIPKKKALEEYEAYKEELRHAKTQFNEDMLSLYAHMKHGGKVIDLWEAMKLAGVNEAQDPKLAIVRADSPKVQFEKRCDWRNGQYVSAGGRFLRLWVESSKSWRRNGYVTDVNIPTDFLPEWKKDERGNFVRTRIETITPIIPAKIMNPLRSHKLSNYHILWEVKEWKPVPPKDPMLLKQVTPNMFCVLATWDLTELERAVIRGRIS